MPFWPSPVDEFIVVEAGSDSSSRVLLMAASEPQPLLQVARSRPLSVATIERRDGSIAVGYPVGLRLDGSEEDLVDRPLPATFRRTVLHTMPIDEGELLLMGPNDQLESIALSQIERLVYPNRLNLLERCRYVAVRILRSIVGPSSTGVVAGGHQPVTDIE
jgi:hypothetical protein